MQANTESMAPVVRAFTLTLALAIGAALPALTFGAATPQAVAGGAASAAGINASTPYDLVKTAANTLLSALDAHRQEYRSDPAKLRALVNQTLLPYFDSQFAARAVLARHWDSATPEQRQRFINAFYHSLLNNYGNALLDFTANRMQVLPYRGPANARYAVVDTRVRKSDGSTVDVNYSLIHTDQDWQVWDVVVEGISYDKSFQSDFGEQIDREGLNAVIARLEHGETPAAIRRTAGSSSEPMGEPASAPQAAFVALSADAYRLQVPLRFETVPRLRPEGVGLIGGAAGPLTIDLSGVPAADSAGLALLVDWLACARAAGKSLRYVQLPATLQALARLSEVESLLEAAPPQAAQKG